jgi:hypothetical protein
VQRVGDQFGCPEHLRSALPHFCRFVFWTAIVFAAVGLCAIAILKVAAGNSLKTAISRIETAF